MTIKELERQTGLPRTTIRFYEQEGLIAPERRENNYRDYSEEDAATLEKIKLLRKLSLEVGTISRLKAGELTWQARKVPTRFTSTTSRKISSGKFSKGPDTSGGAEG